MQFPLLLHPRSSFPCSAVTWNPAMQSLFLNAHEVLLHRENAGRPSLAEAADFTAWALFTWSWQGQVSMWRLQTGRELQLIKYGVFTKKKKT